MDSITIRTLDEQTTQRLRLRAAQNNHSMEEEARCILCAALAPVPGNLADSVRALVQPLGGVELVIPPRDIGREPPGFE